MIFRSIPPFEFKGNTVDWPQFDSGEVLAIDADTTEVTELKEKDRLEKIINILFSTRDLHTA
mgnify:CR=1 FL=1